MSLIDNIRKLRNNVIISMSKVTGEYSAEEKQVKEKLNAELNFKRTNNYSNYNNVETGQVDNIKIREITNGNDKYSVQDLLYSFHYDGQTSSWQFGIRVDIKDVKIRDFSVTKGEQTNSLVLKKQKGEYQEYGDSKDSGNYDYCMATFSGYSKSLSVPNDLDLSDTNAIRYHFRNDKNISHFLDKYVIVTNEEKNSYKQYAKEQDKLAILEKSKQDKMFSKVKD